MFFDQLGVGWLTRPMALLIFAGGIALLSTWMYGPAKGFMAMTATDSGPQLLGSFPLLLVDDELHDDTAAGRATRVLVDHLRADGTQVITATELDDAAQIMASTATLSGLLIDWDVHHGADGGLRDATTTEGRQAQTEVMINRLRAARPTKPIFLLADRSSAETTPTDVLRQVNGYVWKLEDTPAFVADRVEEARREYLEPLLPPFFAALVRFTKEARYSWHTPGHSGGTAFLKTAVGSAFHEFFGENTLRSDLSVSVAELGSLMEHTGPVGAAETQAARIFGADRTMFVTNGTSTANKIAFHACVRRGDVVLVDRNCHKSIMHAIVMTGAIPVYLLPTRNTYGIIGPIPPAELTAQAIAAALSASPLVPPGVTEARLAVVTNSTYDGLCYDATAVLDALGNSSRRVLFDEAWFAYARFHPLYAGRHAMGVERRAGRPAIFATQSTHKLLTAFSQASMIHLHDSDRVISASALDEAFMMHTSTSPQYGIIASLDVAARTMDGPQGTTLVDDSVEQALAFRRELTAVARDTSRRLVLPGLATTARVGDNQEQRDPARWTLRDGQDWHGYHGSGTATSCSTRSRSRSSRRGSRRPASCWTRASRRHWSPGSSTNTGSWSRRPAPTLPGAVLPRRHPRPCGHPARRAVRVHPALRSRRAAFGGVRGWSTSRRATGT